MGKLIFIHSEGLGRGDDELGRKLMMMLLYSFAEAEKKPDVIQLMNGGVKLAAEGSDAVAHLQSLVDAGVKVYSCGTCLDYFNLKDKLAVGEVGNMNMTADLFMSSEVVTV